MVLSYSCRMQRREEVNDSLVFAQRRKDAKSSLVFTQRRRDAKSSLLFAQRCRDVMNSLLLTQRRKDAKSSLLFTNIVRNVMSILIYFFAPLRLCALLFLSFSFAALCAQDSTQVKSNEPIIIIENEQESVDSAKLAYITKRFNPQKALLYAAILPGAGQVYNKKYWKVPIVYGGFVFLGYYIDFYNDNYRFYKKELFIDLNTGTNSTGLNRDNIRNIIERYRRERDFFIVLTGLWYALQIIDAHVDSHLKEFDINPNLQVRVEPSFKQDMLLGRQSGFTISIRF